MTLYCRYLFLLLSFRPWKARAITTVGVSVVLRLSFRTLGCRSSDRKHQSNRTKGTGRTKSTYKRLKELGFHSSPLHSSPRAQFIHIRIFYKNRNAPPTTQILRNIPNRRAVSGPFRLWPPPVSAFLTWSLLLYNWHKGARQRNRFASIVLAASAFS